jgi:hypothetical protein
MLLKCFENSNDNKNIKVIFVVVNIYSEYVNLCFSMLFDFDHLIFRLFQCCAIFAWI